MSPYKMATIIINNMIGTVHVTIYGKYHIPDFISDLQKYYKGNISQNGVTISIKLPPKADDASNLTAFVFTWFLNACWEPYAQIHEGATNISYLRLTNR